MAEIKNSKSNLSGESVGLAFVGIGLLWAYIVPNTFGEASPYLSASFILFGFAGFMVEMQKRFTGSEFRWANGGVGVLLGGLFSYLLYLSYTKLSGFWSGLAVLIVSLCLLLALAAIIDFVVSIFEYFVRNKTGLYDRLTGAIKFIALVASTAGAVYAALTQVVK